MLRPFVPVVLLALTYAATLAAETNAKGSLRELTPMGRPATGDELTLLSEVLHKTADDYRRWAYTEHRIIRDEKGRQKSEVVQRFDPSKPYPEQWTPIKIDGKEPTERERAKYRRRGEKGGSSASPLTSSSNQRPTLGELIDISKSSVASETATQLVFEVPLVKVGNERFPPEKFLVLVRVKKEDRTLENISVQLRESFRAKLVVKVKSGGGTMDFMRVDPKHPAALVAIEGDASASILFVSVGGSVVLKRTELKHVKPFDERFDVQIGTLKAIDL